MAETTDPRTVRASSPALLAESPRVRVPSAELDQLRNHTAALMSFRQAVINMCAGRPDTHLMTVAELRAAVGAPPTAGAPLPVTWSGIVMGPTGDTPRERTLIPLTTSHGTQACLAVTDEERTRLAGLLAATLHPAETCTTPQCGATEAELDLYADDPAPDMVGWIAVRVAGSQGPIRWWCSPACANSAITAGGADIVAADRAAGVAPLYTDRIAGGALTRMMATAASAVADEEPIPYDLDERYGDGASDEYVNQLGEAADERGDVDEADAAGGAR